jgi:hypothetical protein
LCSGIGFGKRDMKVSCDSQSVIFMANNLAYYSKTKNIDVQYHLVRDMVESNKVLLEKVNDPDLCRNTMKYKNTHKHRDAAEIRLHFINNK